MLESVYRTKLPKEFHDALAWMQWVQHASHDAFACFNDLTRVLPSPNANQVTLDVFDVVPPECIGTYGTRLAVIATLPLILVAVVMAIALVLGLLLKSKENTAAIGGSISVVIIWAMCPSVSKMIFFVFDCESFAMADDVFGTNATDGEIHIVGHAVKEWYMIAEYSTGPRTPSFHMRC